MKFWNIYVKHTICKSPRSRMFGEGPCWYINKYIQQSCKILRFFSRCSKKILRPWSKHEIPPLVSGRVWEIVALMSRRCTVRKWSYLCRNFINFGSFCYVCFGHLCFLTSSQKGHHTCSERSAKFGNTNDHQSPKFDQADWKSEPARPVT